MRPQLSALWRDSLPKLLRVARGWVHVRYRDRSALGASYRTRPRRGHRPWARDCSWQALLGASYRTRSVDGYFWDYVARVHQPRAGRHWQITKEACLKPPDSARWLDFGCSQGAAARAVWDEARKVCHPHPDQLLRVGGVLGWRAHLLWRFHRCFDRCLFLLKRDRFPFWKAATCPASNPHRARLRTHGVLAGGVLLRFAKRWLPRSQVSRRKPRERIAIQAAPAVIHQGVVAPRASMQVAESALSFAIAAFCLIWLHPRKRYDGQVFVAFVILYAVARFLLEFFRADDRGGLAGLSTRNGSELD